MTKLFLDDERLPTGNLDEWQVCRTFKQATDFVRHYYLHNNTIPQFISFDHDLGENEPTGMDFAKWLCDYVLNNRIDIQDFKFYVHSQNPIGKRNIESYINNFLSVYAHEITHFRHGIIGKGK